MEYTAVPRGLGGVGLAVFTIIFFRHHSACVAHTDRGTLVTTATPNPHN